MEVGEFELPPNNQKQVPLWNEAKPVEEDENIVTLMRYKLLQAHKELLRQGLLADKQIDLLTVGELVKAEHGFNGKDVKCSFVELYKFPLSGFEDFTNEELSQCEEIEMEGPSRQQKEEHKQKLHLSDILDLLKDRKHKSKVSDVDYDPELFGLLMMEEDQPMADIQASIKSSTPDLKFSNEKQKQPVSDIGFGLNMSQNQNDIRSNRFGSKPTIIESQNDLLDMIDTVAQSKTSPPQQVKNSLSNNSKEEEKVNMSRLKQQDLQMESQEDINKLLESPVEHQQSQVTIEKAKYDEWLRQLTCSKYDHYIAWFNQTIGCSSAANTMSLFEPDHDFTIKDKVIDQLKATAFRRANIPAKALVKDPPVVISSPSKVIVHEASNSNGKKRKWSGDAREQNDKREYKKFKKNDKKYNLKSLL